MGVEKGCIWNEWVKEIIFGVSQGSTWDLYSSIFISDLFFILSNKEIANYVDDNPTYCSCNSFKDVIWCLERTADDLF